MNRWMIAVALCCWMALPVRAEPPAHAPAEPAAMQVLRAARSKGKKPDAAATPRADGVLGHPDNGAKSAALTAMHAAAHRAKRDQARRQRQEELRGRLKNREIPTAVRVELRNHSRRISRLQRIRLLAGEDTALIARVDAVIARENTRHEQHMVVLIARAAKAPKSEDDHEQDDEVEE